MSAPAPPTASLDSPATPTTRGRVVGLDLARGLAVLGMIAAHVAAPVSLAWDDPASWAGVVHGRSSILFAVLAGVSIALFSGRDVPVRGPRLVAVRVRLVVRAIMLFLLGEVLDLLGTDVAVILQAYAVLFLLAIPFLTWSPRRLLVAAAGAAVLGPALTLLGDWATASWSLPAGATLLRELLVSGFYPALTWIAFVLLGLGVGRLRDPWHGGTRLRLGAIGVLLALVGYLGGWAATSVWGSPYDPANAGVLPVPRAAADTASESDEVDEGTDDAGGAPAANRDGAGDFLVLPGDAIDFSGHDCTDYENDTYFCEPNAAEQDTGLSPGDSDLGAFEEEVYDDEGNLVTEDTVTPGAPDAEQSGPPWLRWATAEQHSGTPFEVVAGGGVALAVLAGCLALADRARRVVAPVAAVGSMPLSSYALHVVGLAVLGDSRFGYPPVLVWVGFTLLAVVAASLWRYERGQGPLEHLIASVSDRAARG